MPQVTCVADVYPVYIKTEYRIFPPLTPPFIIMGCFNGFDADTLDQFTGFDNFRLARYCGNVIVVAVFEAYGHDVSRFLYRPVFNAFRGFVRGCDNARAFPRW